MILSKFNRRLDELPQINNNTLPQDFSSSPGIKKRLDQKQCCRSGANRRRQRQNLIAIIFPKLLDPDSAVSDNNCFLLCHIIYLTNLTFPLLRYNIVITMYTQKIFQAGNSAVVAIPKELLRKHNLKAGNFITIKSSPDDSQIVVEKPTLVKPAQKSASEKEFKSWLTQTLKEDSEILDELAKH